MQESPIGDKGGKGQDADVCSDSADLPHEDSTTAENPQDVLYSLELCCDHLRQLSFRFDEAVQAA